MSGAEFSNRVQRAARLRAEMERLELELGPRGRIRRVYSFVVDALVLLVILVLMIDGWIAYRTFRTDPPSPGTTSGPVLHSTDEFVQPDNSRVHIDGMPDVEDETPTA